MPEGIRGNKKTQDDVYETDIRQDADDEALKKLKSIEEIEEIEEHEEIEETVRIRHEKAVIRQKIHFPKIKTL